MYATSEIPAAVYYCLTLGRLRLAHTHTTHDNEHGAGSGGGGSNATADDGDNIVVVRVAALRISCQFYTFAIKHNMTCRGIHTARIYFCR